MRIGFAPACRRIIASLSMILFCTLLISLSAQAQTVNSFSPTTICQGEKVTITGNGFNGATSVQLGSMAAASFQVVDDNTITAIVNDFASDGPVRVTTPSGTATNGTLTVTQAPKPSLTDYGAIDQPFTNCDGNATYTLKVRNSSTVYGTGNQYSIDWGDGTPMFNQTDWANGATVMHTYTSHGYKALTITITPSNGCTKTVSYNFYNGKNPLASFTTTNPTTGLCVPAPVEFQIGNWSANTAGTVYEVVFGDGTPNAVLNHPLNAGNVVQLLSHTYNTSSCPNVDYTARLNAKNGCFVTTYTLNQIIVRKKPTADFDINIPPPCVNAPVCLNNTTINGNSGNFCNPNSNFTWDFGDGSGTVDAVSTCHTFSSAGNYTITLTASNAACGADVKSKQLTILAPSQPPTTSPVAYCQGQVASQLTASGTGLRWYTVATGGTALANAPTPLTATPGVYTWYVSQTTPGNCEGPRVPITVTVNASPAAPAAVSPVQLCQNATATPLVATGTDLKWYTTATGGVGDATAPTPNTTNTGTTTYYVSQTTNTCEGPRKAIQVIVNALAIAPTATSPKNYCQNDPATPLTATGSLLLWYNVSTGGVGDATAPTPNTSTVGSSTWYVSQVTGCGESPRATIVVNINARPNAAISYTPAVFCNVSNATSANPPVAVTHSGTTGGTYSISPASGLPINTTTGEVNPSGAAAGTYTITYRIPGSGGCSDYTTTATVTVNGTPTATISYPGLCTSDASVAVQRTGSQGGNFTADPGLTIDAATGTINPSTSTPGTYEVTYTIVPNAPCPGFTTKTNVTVIQAPLATISYTPAVLCNVLDPVTNPPVNVVFSGTTGGTYSVTPGTGLTVNTSTGQINPGNATPGVYTIKYTVPGTGGCRVYETTTSVTVNGAPTATIQYTSNPICSGSATIQKVMRTGTAGGAFSAVPAGLSIDGATGDVNPATSTPGTYTVSYNIAAAPPCPGYTATNTVVINESPTISFPTPNQNICSGQSASFTPTSSVANTSFRWSVSGQLPANVLGLTSGTSSGATPIILSYTNTGASSQTITIQVIAANPVQTICTAAPYNISVTVNPLPPAPAPDTFHLCMAAPPTALQVVPIAGTTIKWYDQANVLLAAPPVVSTAGPAQFIYNISHAFNNGCESPKTKVLAIVHPTAKIVGSSYTHPISCGVPSGTIVLDVVDLNNNGIPNLPVVVHYNNFNIPYAVNDNTDASGKIVVPLKAGMYDNIYVETGIGCLSQKIPDLYVLKDPSPPAQPIAGYNPPLCSETLLQLTALSATSNVNGPIDYVWAGPAFGPMGDTIRNTTMVSFSSAPISYAGTYIVYAIQNNCISPPTTFTVDIKQSPSRPRITTRSPLCIGDDLVLQAASAMPGNSSVIEYTWKGPGPGLPVHATSVRIDDVKLEYSGIYIITAHSPQTGCSSSTDTLIQIGGYPIVKFPQDTLTLPTGFLLKLDPVITNAAEPGILPMKTFAWNPSQDIQCNDAPCSTPIVTIKNNTCYAVKATNIYGCSGSDTICVKVFCTGAQVFVPNAFAPRGNVAENQKLMVRASGIASVKSFRVFNRWGKILFEKNNFQPNAPANGWDGYVNGRLADPGVYIYTVDVICENGVPYTYKGNVTLF